MSCPHKPTLLGINAPANPSAIIEVLGLRPGLPILPSRLANLKLDKRGFPVPWFVEIINGEPDFRVASAEKLIKAIKFDLCWTCGEKLGAYKTFVAGPMCGINRTSAEPPSHKECAEFSAKACPFLKNKRMRRNEKDLPEDMEAPAGVMIKRNPGVTMLWTTKSYKPFRAEGGVLLEMGQPISVEWLAEGREATREEVVESIATGLPELEAVAAQEAGGLQYLAECCNRMIIYLPPEPEVSVGHKVALGDSADTSLVYDDMADQSM